MNRHPPTTENEKLCGVLTLALLSLIVGVFAGFIGALFRETLERAESWRSALVGWAHGEGVLGFLVVLFLCGSAVSLAAFLVHRFSPQASGSGIPNVEAILKGEEHPAPQILIPVKFFGGTLAIGSGLALGREGPSVQMGANVAYLIGKIFRCSWEDCRVLLAAGAGAGLATAFNAPIAGAIFVLEELVRKFETRIAIAALGASATAIFTARLFLSSQPDFHVGAISSTTFVGGVLFILLGIFSGVLGVLYNKSILAAIKLMHRCERWSVELRAGVVGILVGIIAWYLPELVGGGDALTQSALALRGGLLVIPALFLFRFVFGALSYSVGTPGGLFAPMLTLGAFSGLFFSLVISVVLPELPIQPEAFVIVGMAAFFTAVVRAPLTGMVLVVEMTGCPPILLPMLGACFAAMVVPTMIGNKPIYDSLMKGQRSTT